MENTKSQPISPQSKAPEPAQNDLLTAMRAIEFALHDDKGHYFKLRDYLDSHGKYHDNLQNESVILEVAQVAISVAERAALSSPSPAAELDLNEAWRNEECFMCGLARKIVVHSDGALDEYHPFVAGPKSLTEQGE